MVDGSVWEAAKHATRRSTVNFCARGGCMYADPEHACTHFGVGRSLM